MYTNKRVTPRPLSIKLHEQDHHHHHHGTNMMIKGCSSNNVGESSFRVLYYGASTGSVPFMWESQPGTPKHALTQSSLPPLTPPPSYQYPNHSNYSSKRSSSSNSGFLRSMFKKRNNTGSFSSCSVSSSSSSSSLSMSLSMHLAQSTPMSKTEVRRMMKFGLVDDGDRIGSPTSTFCMGGGFKKGCRFMKVKKAMWSFVRHGKLA